MSLRGKPTLFNTDMVRAILDGRKTVTRRVAKTTINKGEPVSHAVCNSVYYPTANKDGVCANFYDIYGFYRGAAKPPYQPGDILYVRETWNSIRFGNGGKVPFHTEYWYKADDTSKNPDDKWRPSIHMPKAAARIFLRVTNVRVERLQDITLEDCMKEGISKEEIAERDSILPKASARWLFEQLWDSTIKPTDRALYGWAANPWVWVIEFEPISREEVT